MPKIGIVLDGGGAKGAYQVGCWKAIREDKTYEIRAIAGSSVGALNAFLMASDRFEDCLKVWTELRPWHVIGIRLRNVLFLPAWFAAVLVRLIQRPDNIVNGPTPSILVSLYLAFLMIVYLTSGHRSDSWRIFGVVFIVVTLAREFGGLVRSLVLNRGVTSNVPLTRKVQSLLIGQETAIAIPAYATLSRWEPRATQSVWYGWAPEYVRFDLMNHASILEVLMASASLPGVFPVSRVLGYPTIDGGWCDNSPLAPILFGIEENLDAIFVLHLGPDALEPNEFSPFEVGGRNPFNIRDANGVLGTSAIADRMWSSHLSVLKSRKERRGEKRIDSAPKADKVDASPAEPAVRKSPLIVEVIPSEFLGGFITGTLAFSASKARKLIDLGERDMLEILKGLKSQESQGAVSS